MMKVFLALAFLFGGGYARSNDGFSSINRQEDGHGNYHYNYDITDWDTNHRRWETVDADNNRRGGYTITDVDGKVRQVEYTADKNGFRAVVKTNEHGTETHIAGDHDAVYVRDGVNEIIRDAQPALQQTGHLTKQRLSHHHYAPAPIVTHRIQPAVVRVQQRVIKPAPVVVHRPVVHESVIQRAEPIVHIQPPVVPVVRPATYTSTLNKPSPFFDHLQRVVHQPAPVPRSMITVPNLPQIRREEVIVRRPVIVDIPAYSGPRRRFQRPVADPSQAFETPEEKVILTPKRVPAYAPDQDLPEEFIPTVPPPSSRLRVAYAPERLTAPRSVVAKSRHVTRFAPITLRPAAQPIYSYGPVHYTASYQPAIYSGSCSRCGGYGKARSS